MLQNTQALKFFILFLDHLKDNTDLLSMVSGIASYLSQMLVKQSKFSWS